MTGRQLLGAVIVIALATAVLPPAAAFAVNRRRIAASARDVAALAARAARAQARPRLTQDGIRCDPGRLPQAESAAAQPWVSGSRATAEVWPLSGDVPADPWGNCYLVGAGWVLSAGPNGTVDTPFGAGSTAGDDIGAKIR